MSSEVSSGETVPQPKWKPIGRIQRRVLGVLVEKAKTTPDSYPLTLNALTNGCNQKSNRSPQMNLEPIQIETALEDLRRQSAALEVAGGGRVAKFRHMMYEWMGVDKAESAVMTELLLRGSQTVGELRGRAARMDASITDVATLQPIVKALIDRGLVLALTPAGRGQIVTHALYLPEELQKVRNDAGATASSQAAPQAAAPAPSSPSPPAAQPSNASSPPAAAPPQNAAANSDEVQQLREEVEKLKHEIQQIKSDVQDLWSNLS